jgi:uncharacterized protein (TIGR02452 family)
MRQQRLNFPSVDRPSGQNRPSGQRQPGPPGPNKAARARLAHEIINKTIPSLLRSDPRAAAGVNGSRLFRGRSELLPLTRGEESSTTGPSAGRERFDDTFQKIPVSVLHLKVSIIPADSFVAAHGYRQKFPHARIAVLNMASTYGPGGGVLRGARAQEEALCLRSTLYPSLQPQWYRLPEDAVAWSEDILVFAEPDPQKVINILDKNSMWYVDVVSCAAIKDPPIKGARDDEYADPRDEEQMVLKIKYIMRACVKMGAKVVVLGAFGCGAYGNPIGKVAGMFRRVLLGRQGDGNAEEDWAAAGIEEVAIAILDDTSGRKVWNEFEHAFEGTTATVVRRQSSS